MTAYLLGIARSKSLASADTTESYWCVKSDVQVGDILMLYCPRAVSTTRQGIFAEAIIESIPNKTNSKNSNCSCYGRLLYVQIKITKRFIVPLTAKAMKNDSILSRSNFVKRNFQGTTFSIDKKFYDRALTLLNNINQETINLD